MHACGTDEARGNHMSMSIEYKCIHYTLPSFYFIFQYLFTIISIIFKREELTVSLLNDVLLLLLSEQFAVCVTPKY